MFLFFDTETTGLPNYQRPLNNPLQPHLVQLAAVLYDAGRKEIESVDLIVNPGVPIPASASAVHGITDDIAVAKGVHPTKALSTFLDMAKRAKFVIAHNAEFDIWLLKVLFARYAEGTATFADFVPPTSVLCTMKTATPIVNLPPTAKMLRAGFNKPKSPTLTECVKFFFDEDLEGAHDALVDVRACARVFFHGINPRNWPTPIRAAMT